MFGSPFRRFAVILVSEFFFLSFFSLLFFVLFLFCFCFVFVFVFFAGLIFDGRTTEKQRLYPFDDAGVPRTQNVIPSPKF